MSSQSRTAVERHHGRSGSRLTVSTTGSARMDSATGAGGLHKEMQMDDRTMLELAAMAAGIAVRWNEHWQAFQRTKPLAALGGEKHTWVPLEDDGDAFRLAVKLRLHIRHDDGEGQVYVTGPNGVYWNDFALNEKSVGELYAATRRAIVRAAAAIGERMP
jgi:hypothetical protein